MSFKCRKVLIFSVLYTRDGGTTWLHHRALSYFSLYILQSSCCGNPIFLFSRRIIKAVSGQYPPSALDEESVLYVILCPPHLPTNGDNSFLPSFCGGGEELCSAVVNTRSKRNALYMF